MLAGIHAYLPTYLPNLPSSIHAMCTHMRIRSEHRAAPHESYFIQVLAMSRGDISLEPVGIVAARRRAYEHRRLRLMQRNVQAYTRFHVISLLFFSFFFHLSCNIHEQCFILTDT